MRELGPVGYVRFLRQVETGRGAFTAEREQTADVATLSDALRQRREAASGARG